MKNKEKYIVQCIKYINEFCDFLKEDCECKLTCDNHCDECRKDFAKWLEEEYNPEPRLSHDEYVILKNTHKSYGWIVRNEDQPCVAFFCNKPIKDEYWWEDVDGYECYGESFNIFKDELFQFIKWEDEEPTCIKELLDEYEKYYKEKQHD